MRLKFYTIVRVMTLPEGYVVKNTFVDLQERCPMLKRHYSWHAGDDAALMKRHMSPIWDDYSMSKCHEKLHYKVHRLLKKIGAIKQAHIMMRPQLAHIKTCIMESERILLNCGRETDNDESDKPSPKTRHLLKSYIIHVSGLHFSMFLQLYLSANKMLEISAVRILCDAYRWPYAVFCQEATKQRSRKLSLKTIVKIANRLWLPLCCTSIVIDLWRFTIMLLKKNPWNKIQVECVPFNSMTKILGNAKCICFCVTSSSCDSQLYTARGFHDANTCDSSLSRWKCSILNLNDKMGWNTWNDIKLSVGREQLVCSQV